MASDHTEQARRAQELLADAHLFPERAEVRVTALLTECDALGARCDELHHERNVLQKISARRAGMLERVGLHADCTKEEADALAAQVAQMRAALLAIARLDPIHDSHEQSHNEWGEAECFTKAQDIARAALAQRAAPAPNAEQESRAMFVARLESLGDEPLTAQAVLALLNDCDMLASRAAPAPAAPQPDERPAWQQYRDQQVAAQMAPMYAALSAPAAPCRGDKLVGANGDQLQYATAWAYGAPQMLITPAPAAPAEPLPEPVAFAAGLDCDNRGFLDVKAWSEGEFTDALFTADQMHARAAAARQQMREQCAQVLARQKYMTLQPTRMHTAEEVTRAVRSAVEHLLAAIRALP